MKSPIDYFFKLGEKMSPENQADFSYYMIWILFLAFVGMCITNILRVISGDWYSLIWAGVGFAVASLQYFNLRQMYQMRQLRKMPAKEEKVESVNDMVKMFKKLKGGKKK